MNEQEMALATSALLALSTPPPQDRPRLTDEQARALLVYVRDLTLYATLTNTENDLLRGMLAEAGVAVR